MGKTTPKAAKAGKTGKREASSAATAPAFDFASIPAPPPSVRFPPPPPPEGSPAAGENYLELGVLDRLGDDLKEELDNPKPPKPDKKKPPTEPAKEKSHRDSPEAKEKEEGGDSESLERVNKDTQGTEDKAPPTGNLPPTGKHAAKDNASGSVDDHSTQAA